MSDFTVIKAIIPTSTLDVLAKKIEKVNNKGGTFEYRVVGTTTIERHFDYEGIPRVANIHASIVEVIGQQTGVDGAEWKFIAHLDHFTDPAIVTTALDDKSQTVAEYRYHAANCEHCKLDRNRRYTYIAENTTTGTRVQVGSTCLQAYFGNTTAERLILLATWVRSIPKWFDDEDFQGNSSRPYYDTMRVLKGAAQSILNRGYHKTDGMDIPTRNDAPFINGFSDEAVELAEKAATWIKELNTNDGFQLDMQAAVGSEWVDYRRHGGILCYIPEAYRKCIAKQAADKLAAKNRTEDCPNDTNRHQITATVISIKEVDDYYGLQVKLLAETTGGYRLYGTCPRPLYDAEPGDAIQFDCKIKFKSADYGFINRPTKASIVPE